MSEWSLLAELARARALIRDALTDIEAVRDYSVAGSWSRERLGLAHKTLTQALKGMDGSHDRKQTQ